MNPVFKAAVIGDPIDHSWSPLIFNYLSQKQGHPISYQKLKISAQDWEREEGLCSELRSLQGWNVTLPLKKRVLSQLDLLSEEAQVLGAVNVVHRLKDSRLKGYNTDVFGIIQTLKDRKAPVQGQVATVLGAGGAALAAAYALGKMGAKEVRVMNRTLAHAEELITRMQSAFPQTTYLAVSVGDRSQQTLEDRVSLFINATPIGMKGYPQTFDLCEMMNPRAFAFDLVYSASITPFLEKAQSQGLSFVGGLDMLVWQALATWEIWMGPLDSSVRLKTDLIQHLQEHLRRI
jgi:shikimate dehydrogenase